MLKILDLKNNFVQLVVITQDRSVLEFRTHKFSSSTRETVYII